VHYGKKNKNKRSSQQGKREKIQIDGFWHYSPNAKKKKRELIKQDNKKKQKRVKARHGERNVCIFSGC
jgi:hypothetical protein